MVINVEDLDKILGFKYVESGPNNLLELHYVLCSVIKEKLGLKVSSNSSNNFIRNLRLEERPFSELNRKTNKVLGLTFYNVIMTDEKEYDSYILKLDTIKKALSDLHIQMINPQKTYNESMWNGIDDDNQLAFIYYILDFDQKAIDYLRTKIVYYKLMRK